MYSESRDGARVRHVPIHVEPRSNNNTRNTNNSSNNNQTANGATQNREQYTPYYNEEPQYRDSYSQTLPNTSRININHQSSRTPPPSYQQNPSANNSQCQQECHRHQLHNENRDQDRRNSPINNNQVNSDKLVNSPEPIPLPPPQTSESNLNQTNNKNVEQEQNVSSQTEQVSSASKQQQQQSQKRKSDDPLEQMNAIKVEVTSLLKNIIEFNGISAESKDYRFIDEMLTRCILNSDKIVCGESVDLRQQRKATIKLVDQATDFLQRKLQINSEIQNLSESMTASLEIPVTQQ